jgi:DinB superfamily
MIDRLSEVVSALRTISTDAESYFSSLSSEQLNWKPAITSWSVAQCFDHLITINSLYFPLFERLRSPNVSPTIWERYSPLSGFFGRYLIKNLNPDYSGKMNTSKKAYPSFNEIDYTIIERFIEHQRHLAEHIRSISRELDLKKTIITSPLMGFVTYSVDDCLTVLVVHEQRHFLQAQRVMRSQEFPKGSSSAIVGNDKEALKTESSLKI